jgi:hypothetical protein
MTLEERYVYMAPNWRLAFKGIWLDIKVLVFVIPELGPPALGANRDRNSVKGALIPIVKAFNVAPN